MPIKRRSAKSRAFRVTPAAVSRWRAVRPHGIGDVCIEDAELGELVGIPALLAMREDDLQELYAALEEACR